MATKEPIDSVVHVKPKNTFNLKTLYKPVEHVKPEEPVEPVEPVEPIEPVQPVERAEPVEQWMLKINPNGRLIIKIWAL